MVYFFIPKHAAFYFQYTSMTVINVLSLSVRRSQYTDGG